MAIQLDITWVRDSVEETVSLNESGCKVLGGWCPKSASAGDDTVTEELNVQYIGTKATVLTFIRKLNWLFDMARRGEELMAADRYVYLEFAPDEIETTWRSPIRDGIIELLPNMSRKWNDNRQELRIIIVREAYWEGAEAGVPLTNGNGTDVTTGLNVYTCTGDGTGSSPNERDNWALINDEDVEGDMPCPSWIRLSMPATLTSSSINRLWMMAHHDIFGEGGQDRNFETFNDTGVSPTSDADASGGTYYAIPITAAATVEATFAFTPADVRNQWKRFFLRTFGPAPDGMWIRLKARNIYDYVVGQSPWVQVVSTSEAAGHTRVYDLGLLKIDPLQYGLSSAALEIAIECYVTGGGTLNLDAIQCFSVNEYAELGRGNRSDFLGYTQGSPPTGISIVEDLGVRAKRSYVTQIVSSVTYYSRFFSERIGDGIWLIPGINQYIYLVVRAPISSPNDVDHYVGLEMLYRPRRRNL